MSYQVAAIRLLAASKGDNGRRKKAFRAGRDFFQKNSKSTQIRGFHTRVCLGSITGMAAMRKKIAARRHGNCRIN
jgi:hypothetical protein